MSNEERNDETVDETSDTEEQDEEYSYTDEPKASGGGNAGIWVIIILVILALIAVAAYHWIGQQQEQQRIEAEERVQRRQQQVNLVSQELPEAEAALKAGDIDAMVEKLQQMDQKLSILASAANESGDTEQARQIAAMRQPLKDAISSLEPIYEEIKTKREEIAALEQQLSETAATSLDAVSARFGGGGVDTEADEVPPAEAEGEAEVEGETMTNEAAAAEEAPADEAAADGEATDEASAEEAAPQEDEPQTPAEDVAPEAPVDDTPPEAPSETAPAG